MPKSPMHIRGMFGLGDNLHQRAALRILAQDHSITLETMWASVYHDLVGPDFKLIRRSAALRTQLKNAEREAHLFSPAPPNLGPADGRRFSYNTSTIEHRTESKTVLECMFAMMGIQDRYQFADYRLPVPQGWLDGIDQHIAEWETGGKPIMIYRPLTARPEWVGGTMRNANPETYSEMASMLRDRYFIVSVADLEPNKEWIVGPPFPADVCYHKGEFYFELLAALFRRADLILTSGGYAAILGSAVETPVISIKGGFEPVSWHSDAGKFSPYLAIPTIVECRCGTSGCCNRCTKEIDIPKAREAVNRFVDSLSPRVNIEASIIMDRLALPDVTLVCVETQTHDMARIAIDDAMSKVDFKEVILYTDEPGKFPGLEGVTMVKVPNWPNKIDMGRFYYSEAAAPISTSHALMMEWDAGIRDVREWDPAFLAYDYIGAPWPGPPYAWDPKGGSTVGNGGFCLMSKRLIDYIYENRSRISCTTDMDVARNHRNTFEHAFGAKWAPEDVAYRFSFECGSPEQAVKPSFGYHDVFNWHLALPNDETIRRTRLLMQNDYIVTKTPKLNLLGRSAPWIKSAIPEFAAAEARNTARPITARHLSGRERIKMLQPGVGVVTPPRPDPNEARRAYERELQKRGLKA